VQFDGNDVQIFISSQSWSLDPCVWGRMWCVLVWRSVCPQSSAGSRPTNA